MMIRRTTFILALAIAVRASKAQQADLDTPDFSGITDGKDPSLVTEPNKNIDYPGCFSDLDYSDTNKDGKVDKKEYLTFIQKYGVRKCFETDKLTLQQHTIFNHLACMCESLEGRPERCCLGPAAHIETAGALSADTRTEEQQLYLTSVCKITDGTIDSECPPEVTERADPIPWITKDLPDPASPVSTASTDGGSGLSDAAKWGLIAGLIALLLLLLLLCCCCCVFRRRKSEQEEEQENMDGAEADAKPGDDVETAPEMHPDDSQEAATPPDCEEPIVVQEPIHMTAVPVAPAPVEEESEYEEEEEGRKRRGNNMGDEEDEEPGRRLYADGELPPEDYQQERLALRPVEPEPQEEDPDWDQPGRDIQYPKDTDEMSEGHVDHYEPDGGVYIPERPPAEPTEPYKPQWERLKKEEPDEVDPRKHRIQTGLGEGEVWDKLNERDDSERNIAPTGDVFDWVVQSALGVLDKSDAAALADEASTGMQHPPNHHQQP